MKVLEFVIEETDPVFTPKDLLHQVHSWGGEREKVGGERGRGKGGGGGRGERGGRKRERRGEERGGRKAGGGERGRGEGRRKRGKWERGEEREWRKKDLNSCMMLLVQPMFQGRYFIVHFAE